mmetsp:Transcript_3735/g.13474  ORF Transcript_3735/g.13474 Transcript_3735/m.13474 type:complete len:235 (+) Transcript_3735:697-1401(+)
MRARRVNGDAFNGKSKIPCKCVANIPRAPHASSASSTAPAMAVPCDASVPRPSSSTMTNVPGVHAESMLFISIISTANELKPSLGLSVLDIRTMRASRRGTRAACAGTCKPHCASNAHAATARKTVLLPAMFGPVKMSKPSTSSVFGTVVAPSMGIQNGTRLVNDIALAVSPWGSNTGAVQRLFTACDACATTATQIVDAVAAPTRDETYGCKSSARFRKASATATDAACVAMR